MAQIDQFHDGWGMRLDDEPEMTPEEARQYLRAVLDQNQNPVKTDEIAKND